MNNFERVKLIIKKNKLDAELIEVNAKSLSLDDHVNTLGIGYSEGMATLLFRDEKNIKYAVLRRDDRNIESAKLKKVLGVKKLSFLTEEETLKSGFEPGLVSPFLLKELGFKVVVDSVLDKSNYYYCGSADKKYAFHVKLNSLLEYLKEYTIGEFSILNVKRTINMKKRILTGDRPTGKLHIGHYFGSLQNRAKLQDEYEQFVLIANVHALADNTDNPAKVRESISELLCDYYAAGIDFNKTTVYIQSEVPEVHEIFMYLANFASVQQLMHNPTLKTEIKQNSMEESTPLGFFLYPIHQAADILCVNADLVPVGKDQAPMIEDTRELARKFNKTYGVELLNQPQALFGVEQNVPGLDGKAKMSKSLGNCIYLSDTEEELRKKVFSVYTDPRRIRATDPGKIEGNVAFAYHDLFNTNLAEVEELKSRYKEGKVGDVEVKQRLFEVMNEVLTPIRERRIEAEGKRVELMNSALEGSAKVNRIARGIADQMKEAMKIKF
ncbi:MAG: hypothetical protein Fur003_2140 [Candidatus Dojkabacteria bacterium]